MWALRIPGIRGCIFVLWACTASLVAAQPCTIDDPMRLTVPEIEGGDGTGISVAIDGDVAAVGAWLDDHGGLNDAGSVLIYRRIGSTWQLEARLVAQQPTFGEWFGRSVAVDGDVVLVGAERGDGVFSRTGTATVFRFDGSGWVEEAVLVASDPRGEAGFGAAVAIDGDVALIGAPRADGTEPFTQQGAAYVFRYDGSEWIEEEILLGSGITFFDAFGTAVAIDGSVAIVGAEFGDRSPTALNTGTAHIFHRVNGGWSEVARLAVTDATSEDSFGAAVAIDGNIALVGSPATDGQNFDSGVVVVYAFDGTSWAEVQQLVASDSVGGERFGSAVDLDGDWLAVGARFAVGEASRFPGAIYVFHRHPGSSGVTWGEEGKLFHRLSRGFDELGAAVAIDGHTVLGGAPVFSDLSLSATGAAFVFGPVHDCENDGILDRCQTDCNLNGIHDTCELAAGIVDDDNKNGILDVCECGCLDLFFLIDDTATMGEAISTIQADLPRFVEHARERSVDDLRLGLIRFGSQVDVLHDLTFEIDEVLVSLMGIGASGGGPSPEASDAALQELFEKNVELSCLVDATPQYPEELDPEIDFRKKCLKVAVLLTDALPTGCDDGDPSTGDLENAAQQAQNAADAGVQIFAIYPPDQANFPGGVPGPVAFQIREIMERYADLSGGIFAEVGPDASGLLNAVLEGLDRCLDCNNNQVSDFVDIAVGDSLDTNSDTRPDECEAGACCVAECQGEGDPPVVLQACLTGEIPFVLSCRETTRPVCETLHLEDPLIFGTFSGIGSDCGSAGCGGACCSVEGCTQAPDEVSCGLLGGTYRGDGTNCEQPGACQSGGCCYNEGLSCDDGLTLALCVSELGGDWIGPESVCGEQENCLGACCTLDSGGFECRQTTRYTCEEALTGHFSGEGTSCDAEDFTGCDGACCEGPEACLIASFEECTDAGLLFAGPGTVCAEQDTCADYGACWVAGTCLVTSRLDCASAGGSYLGAGRTCGDSCAPPPGSCPGDLDLDGDIDEDDLQWLAENVDGASTCIFGVGDCDCDRLDLCESQTYDPECWQAYLEEHQGTTCL